MNFSVVKGFLALMYCMACFSVAASAQDMPAEYRNVLRELDRSGDFKDQVLKVNIPRNDLQIKVRGVAMPTPFGFGGWVAMEKGDGGMEVLMGDLVLLESEVNPIMSALLENGIAVTALHNHFFWEEPRVFYMHVHGMGDALDLARRLKPALSQMGQGQIGQGRMSPSAPSKQAQAQNPPPSLNAENLVKVIGYRGEWSGAVYKITIGRGDVQAKEHGAVINARMGLNTWGAFTGTNEQALVAGDVAMLESEVTPVLKALRKNGLDVVAIHHHMIGVQPAMIFLHYWGAGPAEKLAMGFKAALDQLGKGNTP